jgi:hypothetical protein
MTAPNGHPETTGFTQLPNAFIEASAHLSHGAFRTYCVLLRYAQGSHTCYPSQATIARQVGVGCKQARAYITELCASGLVERQTQPDRSSCRYTLSQVVERRTDQPGEVGASRPQPGQVGASSTQEVGACRPQPVRACRPYKEYSCEEYSSEEYAASRAREDSELASLAQVFGCTGNEWAVKQLQQVRDQWRQQGNGLGESSAILAAAQDAVAFWASQGQPIRNPANALNSALANQVTRLRTPTATTRQQPRRSSRERFWSRSSGRAS